MPQPLPKPAQKKGAEFLCKVRYKNPLPPLPFAPKLLEHAVDVGQLTAYRTQDWMKRVRMPVLAELDLGVAVDIVDPDAYRVLAPHDEGYVAMDEQDLVLLEPAQTTKLTDKAPADDGADNASRHRPLVSWLRRTEYISMEGSRVAGRKKENMELKRLQQQVQDDPELFDRSRDAQLRAIEKTFAASQEPLETLKHPTKATVHAVESIPVYPDFEMWPQKFTHCLFDDDPAPRAADKRRSQMTVEELESRALVDAKLSNALFKPFANPNDLSDQFLAYFLPTAEGMECLEQQKILPDDDAVVPEEFVRKYRFNTVKVEGAENIFFVLHDGKAYYNSVSARIELRKKRKRSKFSAHHNTAMGGADEQESDSEIPTHVNLKLRDRTAEELEAEEAERQEDLDIVSSSIDAENVHEAPSAVIAA